MMRIGLGTESSGLAKGLLRQILQPLLLIVISIQSILCLMTTDKVFLLTKFAQSIDSLGRLSKCLPQRSFYRKRVSGSVPESLILHPRDIYPLGNSSLWNLTRYDGLEG